MTILIMTLSLQVKDNVVILKKNVFMSVLTSVGVALEPPCR